MSTATRTRPLVDTEQVMEGDCPGCPTGPWPLNDGLQVPTHDRAVPGGRRRCPCSGWLARNPHPRKPFYTEGVRFL